MTEERKLAAYRAGVEITATALWIRNGQRKCSSCKTNVVFVKSATTGKWQILDWQPDWTKGNLELSVDEVPVATVVERQGPTDVLYIDHHATCPQADQHRRRK